MCAIEFGVLPRTRASTFRLARVWPNSRHHSFLLVLKADKNKKQRKKMAHEMLRAGIVAVTLAARWLSACGVSSPIKAFTTQ
jgi:hypothetical protein